MADTVAIGLRVLAYAAALHAAGIPVFIALFGQGLDRTQRRIGKLAAWSAVAALLLMLAHAAIEPARLTGQLSGVLDLTLHGMLLSSDAGTAKAVRLLGLILILGGAARPSRAGRTLAVTGAALVAASFAFTGHTAAAAQRWLLAPLLIVHLLLIAFWFGALLPLLAAVRHETARVAGAIVQQFSRAAVLLVPVILIAGIALAALLLTGWSGLRTGYGALLAVKVAGFAALMALAAANKWRLGPGLVRGDPSAAAALQRSILVEWLLIVVVIGVSAVMTASFSPAGAS